MRAQFAGGSYHVMSRGDQRQDIFFGDVDRHDFKMNPIRARLLASEERLLA